MTGAAMVFLGSTVFALAGEGELSGLTKPITVYVHFAEEPGHLPHPSDGLDICSQVVKNTTTQELAIHTCFVSTKVVIILIAEMRAIQNA